MKNLKSGALIAIAAGSLFASACKKDNPSPAEPSPAEAAPAEAAQPAGDMPAAQPAVANDEKTAEVDCGGVNACKGQGSCKTETHGCGGQNACKGQGVLTMSEEDCKAKGGTIAARK